MDSSTTVASTDFDCFGLHNTLLRGIEAAGFETPRTIQRETIPAAIDGRDVLGLAQTGTGKTAAFALPLLNRILRARRPGPRALILAPTRELATQIATEIKTLARFTKVKVVTIYGGVSQNAQVRGLRERPEIVVGCPGRVLDLLQQRLLKLNQVETFVLDEADHMFDMGFLPVIRKIVNGLPGRRQNLMFSATMPKEIRGLADAMLNDPHVVELADSAPASTIDHALYMVDESKKRALLDHLLSGADCSSAIVFTRTKHRARRLAEQLCRAGHEAVALQGNMSQNKRDRAMQGFRDRRFDVLVATDIAARGIDVRGVSHVINFDVPNTPEAYTHRIGRTGRSENEGVAFTFVTHQDRNWLRATERKLGEPIQRKKMERFDSTLNDNADWTRRPRSPHRSSRPQMPRGRALPRGDDRRDSRRDRTPARGTRNGNHANRRPHGRSSDSFDAPHNESDRDRQERENESRPGSGRSGAGRSSGSVRRGSQERGTRGPRGTRGRGASRNGSSSNRSGTSRSGTNESGRSGTRGSGSQGGRGGQRRGSAQGGDSRTGSTSSGQGSRSRRSQGSASRGSTSSGSTSRGSATKGRPTQGRNRQGRGSQGRTNLSGKARSAGGRGGSRRGSSSSR